MILLFLKSIIIGVANIIPGVSGGTLAVMLNVYDPITEKIGNFFLVDRKTKLSYFFYEPQNIPAPTIYSELYDLSHLLISNFLTF